MLKKQINIENTDLKIWTTYAEILLIMKTIIGLGRLKCFPSEQKYFLKEKRAIHFKESLIKF